jgi:RND superfamily putative drug exporter
MAGHRRAVLWAAVGVAVAGVLWGSSLFSRLVAGGFEDPHSESARTAAAVAARLGDQNPDVVVLYSDPAAAVTDPVFRNAVTGRIATLRALPQVAGVLSYYDTGAPGLVSADRHATYAVVRLRALDDSGKRTDYDAIKRDLPAPGVSTEVGGAVATEADLDDQTKKDVTRGEMIAMPIVLALLVLVFGGLVAALLPLLVGALAVLGALSATRVIASVTDVSTFAVNSITLLGLGMAVDYSLLVVSRFRAELRAGLAPADAVARTVATAGRTVLVSGLTVLLSLASLLVFPQVFLHSMAYGGMAAVLVAMVSALTVLPAVLGLLGPRVNALRVPLPRRRGGRADQGTQTEGRAWARLAHGVMRHPLRYIGGVLVVLALLAAPLLHVRFGSVDERVLPAGDPARVAAQRIETDFHGAKPSPIQVLVDASTRQAAQGVQERISALPDVTGVGVAAQRGTATLLSVDYPGPFAGDRARAAVGEIRALRPDGARLLVGGDPAVTADEMASLGQRLPWMLAVMAAVTLVLLLAAFRSVILPVKAVVMNLVSLGASFGALVWGFQDGHLAGLLGFTTTGYLEPTVLILVLAVLFGLATDYEVFLLSAVREEWDATGDNRAAVAAGLQRTGRIITAAALLLILVAAGFGTGQIVITKLIGAGMVVAIAVDATLVRALLVPATMRLLGRFNWWAPGRLAPRRRPTVSEPGALDGPVASPARSAR